MTDIQLRILEQVDPNKAEAERYRRNHLCCPVCNHEPFISTLAAIVDGKDLNSVTCSNCSHVHRVHDRVPKKSFHEQMCDDVLAKGLPLSELQKASRSPESINHCGGPEACEGREFDASKPDCNACLESCYGL